MYYNNGAGEREFSIDAVWRGVNGLALKRSRPKYLLSSTSSFLALIFAVTAHADINVVGDVSPAPVPGSPLWDAGGATIMFGSTGITGGQMTVSAGAKITNADSFYIKGLPGGSVASSSILTVTGIGSTVAASSDDVGINITSYGTLVVADGGVVTVTQDARAGEGGAIDVGGTGSLLDVSHGTITLGGNAGSVMLNVGHITVHDGGRVAANTIALGASGSTPSYGYLYIGANSTSSAAAPGTVSANVINSQGQNAHGNIVFNHTASDYTFSPQINGGISVDFYDGVTELNNTSNNYTGGSTLFGGALSVASDHALGASSSSVTFNGGLLKVTGTSFTSAARTLTWGTAGGGFDIDNAGNTFTVAQNLTDGGQLTKSGAGTLVLSGANSYIGGTSINDGALSVGSNGNLGATSGGLTFNGGLLKVTGTSFTSTARTLTWGVNGGGFDIDNAGNTFTVSQNLTSGGKLSKLGAGTLVLSGNNTYTGGTYINGGTVSVSSDASLGAQGANNGLNFDGGTLSVTEDMNSDRGVSLTSTGGTVLVDAGKVATFNGVFGNAGLAKGKFTKAGAGTMIMTAQNSYTGGTTISGGILQLGDGVDQAEDSIILGDIVNNGSLVVDNVGNTILSDEISSTGLVTQNGAGVLTLSGNNSYSGGTIFNKGVILVSQDENLGSTSGSLTFDGGTLKVVGTHFSDTSRTIVWGANGGSFDIDDSGNTFTLSNVFTGSGALTKLGAGMLAFTGSSNVYTGNTLISEGTMRLDDGVLGGTLQVASDASFGGHGTIGGAADVASGATLFARSGNVLLFQSGLTLHTSSNTDVTINGGPSATGLFQVDNGLTVDGTLTVNQNSTLGIGVYRIFDSSSPLTDNGMTLAAGSSPDFQLQVLDTQGQINLVNTDGRTFSYWDGINTTSDGIIHGGDGTWEATSSNWTDINGNGNEPWNNGTFAVFQANAGHVTVQNGYIPQVNGMQFLVDGYTLTGGPVQLVGWGGPPQLGGHENWIVVGDGSVASANITANITSEIQGQSGFNKSGYGTLNLTGANTYSGTTTVSEGILALGDGGSINNSSDIFLTGTAFDHGALLITKNEQFTLGNSISGIGEVVKDGTGTTVFAGDNSFSGGLTIKGGTAQAGIADSAFSSGSVKIKEGATLDLADFNETIGNLLAFDTSGAIGDGNITLGAGTLTLNQTLHSDFSGIISGTGGLTLNSSNGASVALTGVSSYSGATNVNGAELIQGALGAFSAASAYSIDSAATLDLGGFSTSLASLTNGGVVLFGGLGGTVLTIAGDYVGNGGMLAMNTVLEGDDSQTDLLMVSGSTAGTTTISIDNRGGLGAQTVNGIKIVDVGGVSNATFELHGDYVTKDGQQAIMTSSAYAYTLQKNPKAEANNNNWYLVSQDTRPEPIDPTNPNKPDTPRYSAGVPVYEAYGSTLQALNRLPTLQQRVGDRHFNGAAALYRASSGEAFWGRIAGAHSRLESGTTADILRQDINTLILQTGVDGQLYESNSGKLIAGLTGQYGNAHSGISNYFGDGSIKTQGWGIGATTTWYGDHGFYVDGQAQINWYDSDLNSDTLNKGLSSGNKALGYALSIETGKRYAIDEHWALTPQAQFMFSSVDFNSFTDGYGGTISNHNGNSLTGRLGLAANYASKWQSDDGKSVSSNIYGIANLYQEFLGGSAISYTGARMNTDNDLTWGGVGAGGSYVWADTKYAIYGEGSVNTSLDNFADSYSVKGDVGFKVTW